MRHVVLPGLDPAQYPRHALHADTATWVEKNCYIDLWIELLNALRLEPLAMLGFTIAIDFEGDQWTFYKPSHDELRELYGVDVQEMNVWRSLLEHAQEHLPAGKLISTEADAFWLPDTSGTDYRSQHTKTTIVLNDLDLERQRLGYFHNAGYYALEGEDFIKTFRLDAVPDPTFMPLFAELVRVDKVIRREPHQLAELAIPLLRKYLTRAPRRNPIKIFAERFAISLPQMQERGLPYYHAWAFATTRQLGSAFELAAHHVRWLESHSSLRIGSASDAFDRISSSCKSYILKGARAVNSKRPLDAKEMFAEQSEAWDQGLETLRSCL
ncbi:MAG TPA: DUF1839 family protein [Steroidobacteraceae bacterium]|nr:DUF1839 family protein [Steroidobacteraceae bacterium]